jgi:Rps23 Pro-64 3,4-dihydroxylase Tpa1-like proline 4-hydroxylase
VPGGRRLQLSGAARLYAINPSLDRDELARQYAGRGRLQIRDFLAPESAERIHEILANETPWGVAYNEGTRVVQLSAEQARQLTAEQRQRVSASINERARHGYQFFYYFFPMLEASMTEGYPAMPLFDVLRFLNGDEFLAFVRRLTGFDSIRWADAHATLYRAGHFLKYHTDEKPSDQRVCAYVLSFTKGWGRDWGGYLQFFNERYDVEEGLRPVFNALNIFTVPVDHSVSQVAAYAPGSRFSITGWLRADAPPAWRR